jgi:four helix bundle protein
MTSEPNRLAARVKAFAVRVIRMVDSLPRDYRTSGPLRQLVDAAGAQSANYHAARRARTRKEYVAKLGTVAEEADETEHWRELIAASGRVTNEPASMELASLLAESRELRAIFVASARTARANYQRMCDQQRRRRRRTRSPPDPKIHKSKDLSDPQILRSSDPQIFPSSESTSVSCQPVCR